ncbi:MAG TPA: ribonuclease HII [Dehalococcoidia bacterium]|jgi:ribonuclease HII|nr:ribonuclease HII [Dehalococcoidia bacterium]
MPKRASFRIERTIWGEGTQLIAGVDEVGRGPLAGPVAAGAVILPAGQRATGRFRFLKHVNDSKQLTPEAREEIAPLIWENAVAAEVAFVSVETIDRIGIAEASRQAMLAAIGALTVQPEHLLLDAFPLHACRLPQTPIIGGDGLSLSIAAASIIAKVARDRLMDGHETEYPGYGFQHNKGYYTAEHAQAIQELGPCDIHRRSFSPVKEMFQRQLGLFDDAAAAAPGAANGAAAV